MNTEHSLMPIERPGAELLTTAAPNVEEPPNPLLKFHAVMRGRYPWAALLGLILGGAGGAAGLLLTEPEYESMGLIEIKPKDSPVIRSTIRLFSSLP